MNKENKTLPDGLKWSTYTLLNQIPINKEYIATDDGIFISEYNSKSKEIEKKLICEAFTIVSVNSDRNRNEEFTEIQFIEYSLGTPQVISKQIATKSLTEKEGIKELQAAGFTIANDMGYKKFIALVKVNLNTLTRKGIKNTNTKRFFGSSKYGFEIVDGEKNFDNFIGLDNPILPNSAYNDFDKKLFKQKGTLEGFKNYLEWIAEDSKCKTIYKQVVGIALTSVVKAFIGGTVDNPEYCIASPTSTGKGFLGNIICAIWGAIGKENTIRCSSSSSLAGLKALKDRLHLIPIIIDDIQDRLKNKNGLAELCDWVYEHTNGSNTIKAQADRSISQYNYSWENTLIMFSEKEDLGQLKDGGATRFALFKTGLKRATSKTAGEFISQKNINEIDKRQRANYGHLAPAFINKMKYYYSCHSIDTEFDKVCKQYAYKMNCTSKDASLYALVEYTYNLAYDFGLLPESWGRMTYEENMANYENNKVVSTDEEIYNLLRDRVLTQTASYIDDSIKLTQNQYEEREEKGQAVRGRITIKEYNYVHYKIAVIPKDVFGQNVIDLEKKHDLTTIKVNPKNWIENGWLIPDNRGRSDHDGTNITREYDKNNDLLRTKERCYWLVLQDLDNFETAEDFQEYTEKFVEQSEAILKKKEEDRIKLAELKAKLNPQPEPGMMIIPTDGVID